MARPTRPLRPAAESGTTAAEDLFASAHQPVVGHSHRRVVGHEVLLRRRYVGSAHGAAPFIRTGFGRDRSGPPQLALHAPHLRDFARSHLSTTWLELDTIEWMPDLPNASAVRSAARNGLAEQSNLFGVQCGDRGGPGRRTAPRTRRRGHRATERGVQRDQPQRRQPAGSGRAVQQRRRTSGHRGRRIGAPGDRSGSLHGGNLRSKSNDRWRAPETCAVAAVTRRRDTASDLTSVPAPHVSHPQRRKIAAPSGDRRKSMNARARSSAILRRVRAMPVSR